MNQIKLFENMILILLVIISNISSRGNGSSKRRVGGVVSSLVLSALLLRAAHIYSHLCQGGTAVRGKLINTKYINN